MITRHAALGATVAAGTLALPRIGAAFRNAIATLEVALRGLRRHRPGKES